MFLGSNKEVTGRMAMDAALWNNEHQAQEIGRVTRLPAVLTTIIADYSAVDARVLEYIYSRKLCRDLSFTYNHDMWTVYIYDRPDEADYEICIYYEFAKAECDWSQMVSSGEVYVWLMDGELIGRMTELAGGVALSMLDGSDWPSILKEEAKRRSIEITRLAGQTLRKHMLKSLASGAEQAGKI